MYKEMLTMTDNLVVPQSESIKYDKMEGTSTIIKTHSSWGGGDSGAT